MFYLPDCPAFVSSRGEVGNMDAQQSTAEAYEEPPVKPLLDIDGQISHLKAKGVTFNLCDEAKAARYLTERTYFFKLAAYRVLFDRRIGGPRDGQYVNLDFGHLIELASFDCDLRYAFLPLTLDVEHAARTKLMRIVAERTDEDGYSIVRDYMQGLNHNERRRREGEINMLAADIFCGDLVGKYGRLAEMPIWVLMELFSFGSFINLYLFCAKRWNDKDMQREHYMLRQAKSIRNACAHSSDIINGIALRGSPVTTDPVIWAAISKAGVSRRVRATKMRNPRTQQIVTLLHLHCQLITEGSGRDAAVQSMRDLSRHMEELLDRFSGNDSVRSFLVFLKSIVDSWF